MYLVERTFKTPRDLVHPETGIITLIEDTRRAALARVGVIGDTIPASRRTEVTDEMTDAKEIVFRSSHSFTKDGIYTLRTVTLFKDEDAYLKHTEETIGVPSDVDETELRMSENGLTTEIVKEEIKRK